MGRVKKLADFNHQSHITSVLRAMIIKNEFSPVVLHGGSAEDRRALAASYRVASLCESPDKGDLCGECSSCKDMSDGPLVLPSSYTYHETPDYIELDNYLSGPPLGFFLHFSYFTKPNYIDTTALLLRLARGETKHILEASKAYGEKYSFETFCSTLLTVLRDLLSFRYGALQEDPSEIFKFLSSTLDHGAILGIMKTLWEFSTTSIVTDDVIKTQSLCAIIADQLNPINTYEIKAGYSEKPINSYEQPEYATLSLDEMESMAAE